MYQQREEPETLDVEGLWRPTVPLVDGDTVEIDTEASDWYVVTDELIGDDVRLAVTPWPRVDVAGRLRFEAGSEPLELERAALQDRIDFSRTGRGQLARPLRIGDAFLVRGPDPSSAEWDAVVDVTRAARRFAKRAGVRAVAQPTTPPEVPATGDASETYALSRGWRRLSPLPPKSAGEVLPPEQPSPGSSTGAVI
jgi:hypothetical protein